MDFSEGSALEIVERLCSAYGVATQKALAECLGIPAANVSNWVQRDSVPGSAFVKCALDTGSDLNWLAKGKLANANYGVDSDLPRGAALYSEITSNGGKPVLRRVMDAYGFTLQKQLCDLLGISSGTVSTWVRRNYFPGDVVVTCAIDTGVSLEWLALGKNKPTDQIYSSDTFSSIPHLFMNAGILIENGVWNADLKVFPYPIKRPLLITSNAGVWISDAENIDLTNGRWVIAIEDKYDIYDVTLLPGKKVNLVNSSASFVCSTHEISIFCKIIVSIELSK